MSVRQGLLALLAEQPRHCYQLRQEFEARTGGTWPVNIGQVYTTLQRLVRDGLAEPADPQADDDARHGERFALTPAGQAEVDRWWTTPVPRQNPARNELAIKIALAVTAPGVDVRRIVQTQRSETLRSLHSYTRLSADGRREDFAWSLVLDRLVFDAEAEVRWLDHVEARVARGDGSGTARRLRATDEASAATRPQPTQAAPAATDTRSTR